MLQSWAASRLYSLIEGDTALDLMIETSKELVDRINEKMANTPLCGIAIHKGKMSGHIECYVKDKKEKIVFRLSYQKIRCILRESVCDNNVDK